MFIDPTKVSGNLVSMTRSDSRHLDIKGRMSPLEQPTKETFSDMLSQAMHGVNDDQIKMTDLNKQLVTDPNSVDVHDVTIAAAQANMSLGLAKAVIDRAVTAYKEIINIR